MQVENHEYLRTLKKKLPIFLINTLLLHIPLLALTHRRTDGRTDGLTDRETNTLASRGQVQLCCCVSFWFWQEIGFGFTYYLCTQGIVPYSCGFVLVFLVLAGNSFCRYVHTQCTILLQPEKKDTVVCLVGARSLLRPEKKDTVVCLVGAR